MYTLSHAIPVNPDGVEPKLTREQVWAGLALKAVDAKPFVDGMTQCDLIERTPTRPSSAKSPSAARRARSSSPCSSR